MPDLEPSLVSIITCPGCGHQRAEPMPTDACLYFYDCTACGRLIRPLSGDCCVFCSYGSVACPPIQASGSGEQCGCPPPGQEAGHGGIL